MLEWLALMRRFFKSPKKGLELLQSGQIPLFECDLETAKKDLETITRLGLQCIVWGDEKYPKLLRHIYDPPLVLLVKGRWPVWEERPWVAVVGARKATRFGKEKTAEVVRELTAKGVGIISGLAYGIDAAAHRACVEAGGVTWGVLGSSIDQVYPRQNFSLAEKMCEQGGYFSEFPLGTKPEPYYFPQRNRIISGLSYAVIIVEATLKSGSLITARYALEQGREVFVVPPPEKHVAYEGNAKLLEEGAMAFGELPKVEAVPAVSVVSEEAGPGVGQASSQLLELLRKPQSLDYLIGKLQKPAHALLAELIQLEAARLVKKFPGGLWQSR